MKFWAFAILLLICASAWAQDARDPGVILEKFGSVYRAPKALELKGAKISEQHDEFTDMTLRTPFTLWLRADNQYRLESKSKMGSSLRVCDGENNWNYNALMNQYSADAGKSDPADLFDSQVDLRTPTRRLKEAKILRREVLETGGAKHLCQVIQASYERESKKSNMLDLEIRQEFGDVTFWVEQGTYLVWKTTVTRVLDMGKFGGKTPSTETILYSSIQLDVDPPAETFVFTPPAGATEQKPGALDKRSNALLGRPAPDFKLRNLDSKEIQLADFKGKVVLLDFWTTWCAPCREEMPTLNKLSKEFQDKDVVVLGIDVGEGEDTVRSFIKENAYQYPILLTSSPGDPVIESYAAHSLPSMVLIDRKGLVADYKVGSDGDREQTLRDDFTRVLGASYAPPTPSPEPKATVITRSTPVVEWPDPVTAIDFLHRGYRSLQRDRNYTSAVQDANAALRLQPDWEAAIRLRAEASYDAKDYDAAVKDCTALIEKHPDWGQMYDRRGLAYSHGGNQSLAIPDYTKAIELDRYVAAFHRNRGWAYLETGDTESAIRDLDDAIELSPEFTRAYEDRAKAFDKRNDLHSELTDLEVILRMEPNNQWARNQRDDVRGRMGADMGAEIARRQQAEKDLAFVVKAPLSATLEGASPASGLKASTGGTKRIYWAAFQDWPTGDSQPGSIKLGFGNTYVLRPTSNIWLGPGRPIVIPPLEGDFVFDVRFRITERNPSASLQLQLGGTNDDAHSVDVFLDVWSEQSADYTVEQGRLKRADLPVTHHVREEVIAERASLPGSVMTHNWAGGGKLTLKREGGRMAFFANDEFIKDFAITKLPFNEIAL